MTASEGGDGSRKNKNFGVVNYERKCKKDEDNCKRSAGRDDEHTEPCEPESPPEPCKPKSKDPCLEGVVPKKEIIEDQPSPGEYKMGKKELCDSKVVQEGEGFKVTNYVCPGGTTQALKTDVGKTSNQKPHDGKIVKEATDNVPQKTTNKKTVESKDKCKTKVKDKAEDLKRFDFKGCKPDPVKVIENLGKKLREIDFRWMVGKLKYKGSVMSSGLPSRPMKFPYTFSAKIAQFPIKFYLQKQWIWKYYAVSFVLCLPLFYKITKLANSPGNVSKWAEIRRKEAAEHH